LATVAAGCQTGPATPDKRVIGVSLLSLANPFFTEIADGLKEEAAKHGYEVIVVSADNDVAAQDKQMRDFLVRRVDAIVLRPCVS
jgi:ABC-type sugar transport system substrate-binding protein